MEIHGQIMSISDFQSRCEEAKNKIRKSIKEMKNKKATG